MDNQGLSENTKRHYVSGLSLKRKTLIKPFNVTRKQERTVMRIWAIAMQQKATNNYYRKCLSKEYDDNRNRVEKKLKELGY